METITLLKTTQRGRPPLPKAAYGVVNPAISLLLHSPFHGLLSHVMMVLKFKGRKTGRKISTPVGYTRQGNSLIVFTFGKWWRNLENNANVTMRLQGKDIKSRSNIVTDPHMIADLVNLILDARGEAMGERLGFERIPPGASVEEIKKKSRNLIFIRIDL